MKHLRENNETYFSHLKFACTIGITLITRGIVFVCHGLVPYCKVPRGLNIDDTRNKLKNWSDHITARKLK